MTFVQQAAWSGLGELTAAISFGASYYVGLVLLSIIMIALLVKAYRVWEELHDVEEPDSPADLLDSFEQAHSEGELDAQELDRLRKVLLEGQGASGVRTLAPPGPRPKAATSRVSQAEGGTPTIEPSPDDRHREAS
ncbi:MAG: hypothetical protein ACLQGP_09500 [Isosphaeraceae bacterium]